LEVVAEKGREGEGRAERDGAYQRVRKGAVHLSKKRRAHATQKQRNLNGLKVQAWQRLKNESE
jgi:hypothetical protein